MIKISSILSSLHERYIDFTRLVELLASANSKIRGAPVLIPEIILFSEGKAKCAIYYDKYSSELRGIYKESLLKNYKLMRWMVNEYSHRRRILHRSKNVSNSRQDIGSPHNSKEDQVLRIGDALMVNVRYHTKDMPSSLSQIEFTRLMMQRPSDKVWEEINYVQNYVTVSKFLPQTFIYNYNAPINPENTKAGINYLVEDVRKKGFDGQAEKICNIIGSYLSKMHGIV